MKKYIFRLGYLLFLAYVPGMLLAEWDMNTTSLKEASCYNVLVLQYLNPWTWLSDMWPNWCLTGLHKIFGPPLVGFVFWLMWSWMKKPGYLKGALLLAFSIFLNPWLSPWYSLGEILEYSPYQGMTFWMALLAWLLYLLYRRLKKAGC